MFNPIQRGLLELFDKVVATIIVGDHIYRTEAKHLSEVCLWVSRSTSDQNEILRTNFAPTKILKILWLVDWTFAQPALNISRCFNEATLMKI